MSDATKFQLLLTASEARLLLDLLNYTAVRGDVTTYIAKVGLKHRLRAELKQMVDAEAAFAGCFQSEENDVTNT